MTDDVQRSRLLIALMLMAAAPVTVALTYIFVRGTLPDRIPHDPSLWSTMSSPERPASVALSGLVWGVVAIGAVITMYLAGFKASAGYPWMAGATFVSWVMAAPVVATLIASSGASSYQAAVGRYWAFPIEMLLLLTTGSYVYSMIRTVPIHDSDLPTPSSSLDLTDSERAVWSGTAGSGPTFVLAMLVLAVSAALTLVWPVLVIAVLFAFGAAETSMVRVRIDGNGVHPRFRWLRSRARDIPLVAIASAETTNHLTAWQEFRRIDWDKGNPDVTQYRVRPGPALSLALHSGKRRSISLDHADEAADVVNALVARHRRLADATPAAAEPGQARR